MAEVNHSEIVELSTDEVNRLRKRYPGLREYRRVVAIALDGDPVTDLVSVFENGTAAGVRRPATWEQARRNVVMRRRILDEFGALTAADLGKWATPGASNPHQYASRLRKANKIFSVPFERGSVYPGFQFDQQGRPHPVLAQVLAPLRCRFGDSDWAIASWFTSPNPHLPGKARPVDVLESDPDAVVAAATAGGGDLRVVS